jgi:hypothetical protein
VHRLDGGVTLRAVAGTGYRAPSLFERYSGFGDPALQPETSESYELAVDKTFGERAVIEATVAEAEPPAASAPERVVSINLCTDQPPMMFAAPGQLVSASHLATDPRSSAMAEEARPIRRPMRGPRKSTGWTPISCSQGPARRSQRSAC